MIRYYAIWCQQRQRYFLLFAAMILLYMRDAIIIDMLILLRCRWRYAFCNGALPCQRYIDIIFITVRYYMRYDIIIFIFLPYADIYFHMILYMMPFKIFLIHYYFQRYIIMILMPLRHYYFSFLSFWYLLLLILFSIYDDEHMLMMFFKIYDMLFYDIIRDIFLFIFTYYYYYFHMPPLLFHTYDIQRYYDICFFCFAAIW